jgi:hypothetical protein
MQAGSPDRQVPSRVYLMVGDDQVCTWEVGVCDKRHRWRSLPRAMAHGMTFLFDRFSFLD